MNEPQQHTMRRMGIIDLMAITTAVAFVFMLHEAAQFNQHSAVPTWLSYTFLFMGAATLGLVLPAIYWIPVHYARTGKIFSQPGHWILGAQLVSAIWSIGFYVAAIRREKLVSEDIPIHFYATANLFGTGFQLVSMFILIIAAITLKEVRWKTASILLAVSVAFYGFKLAFQASNMLGWGGSYFYNWQVIEGIHQTTMVTAAIGIIVAVLVDWKNKVSRDWLHRLALISMLITLTIFPLLQFLLMFFIAAEMA